MGEKAIEFRTSLSVKECGQQFKSGIENGRGLSSRIGGLTAMLMGGESLTWYTPEDGSPFAALNDDRPHFSVGVAVPKAQGAHLHGTNVHMHVWDRGRHRDVVLLAHHSLAGGIHASQLIEAVRYRVEASVSTPAPPPAAAVSQSPTPLRTVPEPADASPLAPSEPRSETTCSRCRMGVDEAGWCSVCGLDLVPSAGHPRFSRVAQQREAAWFQAESAGR